MINNCCKISDFAAKTSNFALSFNMFCDIMDTRLTELLRVVIKGLKNAHKVSDTS